MLRSLFILLILVGTAMTAWPGDTYQPEIPQNLVKIVDSAKALREQKRPDEAIGLLKKVIKESPEYYRAHYNLGLAYSDIKDYKNSIQSFKNALSIKERKKIKEAS